jgi:histidinol-phosphate aminotransferase
VSTGRADELPVRDDLRGLSPYGAPQLSVSVQLNTNENPFAPSPAVVADIAAAVTEAATTLNRYPDREAIALRTDLAAYLMRTTGVHLNETQVWAANGSNEVLQQLLQAFGGPGRTALGFEPSYSMHPILSRGTGTTWISGPRNPDLSLDSDAVVAAITAYKPDVVFLTSPNNPTGASIDLATIAAAYAATRGVVIVDEAYAEFTNEPSAITLLADRPRLIVTRTMSKAFALAGARLGYLAASADVVDVLRLVRLPYHLSAITQAAARAALAHTDELLATVAAVMAQRDRMVAEVESMGLTVAGSDANFVLIGPFTDSHAVWQQLLDRDVLVRDVGIPGSLRVTAGTPDEMTVFLDALRDTMEQHPELIAASPTHEESS